MEIMIYYFHFIFSILGSVLVWKSVFSPRFVLYPVGEDEFGIDQTPQRGCDFTIAASFFFGIVFLTAIPIITSPGSKSLLGEGATKAMMEIAFVVMFLSLFPVHWEERQLTKNLFRLVKSEEGTKQKTLRKQSFLFLLFFLLFSITGNYVFREIEYFPGYVFLAGSYFWLGLISTFPVFGKVEEGDNILLLYGVLSLGVVLITSRAEIALDVFLPFFLGMAEFFFLRHWRKKIFPLSRYFRAAE